MEEIIDEKGSQARAEDQIRAAFKEKREPFDMNEFLKDPASILASFEMVVFIISQSTK